MLVQRVEGMGPTSPAVPGHTLCAAAAALPTPVKLLSHSTAAV